MGLRCSEKKVNGDNKMEKSRKRMDWARDVGGKGTSGRDVSLEGDGGRGIGDGRVSEYVI